MFLMKIIHVFLRKLNGTSLTDLGNLNHDLHFV